MTPHACPHCQCDPPTTDIGHVDTHAPFYALVELVDAEYTPTGAVDHRRSPSSQGATL